MIAIVGFTLLGSALLAGALAVLIGLAGSIEWLWAETRWFQPLVGWSMLAVIGGGLLGGLLVALYVAGYVAYHSVAGGQS